MGKEPKGAAKNSVHARIARIKHERAMDCLALLVFAKRARQGLDIECVNLDAAIVQATNEVGRFSGMVGERIEPRRRVRVEQRNEHSAPRREYLVFLDECGLHGPISADDPFPIFCLCAVIVDREEFATFDRAWKSWKATWLGSWQRIVHEPDIRPGFDLFDVC